MSHVVTGIAGHAGGRATLAIWGKAMGAGSQLSGTRSSPAEEESEGQSGLCMALETKC